MAYYNREKAIEYYKKKDLGTNLGGTALGLTSDAISALNAEEGNKNTARGEFAGGAIGAGIGTLILPGIGTSVGYGIGRMIGGEAGGNSDEKILYAKEQERIAKEQNDLAVKRGAVLSQFYQPQDISYYKKGGKIMKYAYGKKINAPQYEVEKNEMVMGDANLESSKQIASGMQKVTGATHENGGVNGEGGDYVLSNKIKISPSVKGYLDSIGIKYKDNSTYAKVGEDIAKMKSKYEKMKVYNYRGSNTQRLMTKRADEAMDAVFSLQELQKGETEEIENPTTMMKKGGKIKKMADGGPPYGDEIDLSLTDKQKQLYDLMYQDSSTVPIYGDGTAYGTTPINVGGNLTNQVDPLKKQIIPEEGEEEPFDPSISPYAQANVLNVLGYIDNNREMRKIGKYPNLKRTPYTRTPFAYNNKALSDINKSYGAATKAITGTSSQTNNAAKAALFAKAIDAKNDYFQSEILRKNNFDNQQNMMDYQVDLANNNLENTRRVGEFDLNIYKSRNRVQNRNALLQGIMANMTGSRQEDLERAKIAMELAKSDRIGSNVAGRFVDDYLKKNPDYSKYIKKR